MPPVSPVEAEEGGDCCPEAAEAGPGAVPEPPGVPPPGLVWGAAEDALVTDGLACQATWRARAFKAAARISKAATPANLDRFPILTKVPLPPAPDRADRERE